MTNFNLERRNEHGTPKCEINLRNRKALSTSAWAGQVFDIGFAAVCGREKSMPVADGDLDAICGAILLLTEGEGWNTADIARGLGVPEATVRKILAAWKDYRRGQDSSPTARKGQ